MKALSKLVCRYTGFLLGFTMSVGGRPYLRKDYQRLRRRMDAALEEIGASGRLPDKWEEFEAGGWAPRLFQTFPPKADRLLAFLRTGIVVGELTHLGSEADAEIVANGQRGAEELGIGEVFAQLKKKAESIEWSEEGKKSKYEVLTLGQEFLQSILRPLRAERRTCFVIMPFDKSFERYFFEFYRPLLRQVGYRPLRAWCDLGGEFYVGALAALASKCGAALADLSDDPRAGVPTPNLNVLHEIGIFEGLGKVVYLLGQEGRSHPPSNLAQNLYSQYSPDGEDWPHSDIERARFVIAIHDAALHDLKRHGPLWTHSELE